MLSLIYCAQQVTQFLIYSFVMTKVLFRNELRAILPHWSINDIYNDIYIIYIMYFWYCSGCYVITNNDPQSIKLRYMANWPLNFREVDCLKPGLDRENLKYFKPIFFFLNLYLKRRLKISSRRSCTVPSYEKAQMIINFANLNYTVIALLR